MKIRAVVFFDAFAPPHLRAENQEMPAAMEEERQPLPSRPPPAPPVAVNAWTSCTLSLNKECERVMKKQKVFHAAASSFLTSSQTFSQENPSAPHGGGASAAQSSASAVKTAFKELSACVGKLGKAIEKETQASEELVGASVNDAPVDAKLLDELIADHLAREGLHATLKAHVGASNITMPASSSEDVQQALQAARALRNHHDLKPALAYINSHAEELVKLPDLSPSARIAAAAEATCAPENPAPPPLLVRAGDQPLRPATLLVHSLAFLEAAREGGAPSAIIYARKHLAAFTRIHTKDVQKLMGSLLVAPSAWASGPYASLAGDTLWCAAADALETDAMRLAGLPTREPLATTFHAGMEVMPTLHKLSAVLSRSGGGASAGQSWAARPTLPVALEVSETFASTFTCPVSRERASADNEPTLLPCGHALCEKSVRRLGRPPHGRMKCPYCPAQFNMSDCMRIVL
ncbi:E3 ubiquitin-protein transferase RMND5 [Pycnococcus provasolii]